jgi:hypothetical protein
MLSHGLLVPEQSADRSHGLCTVGKMGVTSTVGVGLSSIAGTGLSVAIWTSGLPILTCLVGAQSKNQVGLGLVVGLTDPIGTMPMKLSTSVA